MCVFLVYTAMVTWASSCVQTQSTSHGSISEISVFATPGKLMRLYDDHKPAERIMAKKSGKNYLLIVCINVSRDSVRQYTEDTTTITPADWDSIIVSIEQLHLLDFIPVTEDLNVIDYGSRGFSLVGSKYVEQVWSKPLSNSNAPESLFKELRELARQRIPHLPTYYL